ncbi:hypothetical protein SynA15127_02017 [Synechococcus sp. A15-127]|nr:hypothetical protein SynA15127_02017 [Synechococcus sp. A15-127]
MGPFSGRQLRITTGVVNGSRPSTARAISLDTRFMGQWMKAARQCGIPIEAVGDTRTSAATSSPGTQKQEARESARSRTVAPVNNVASVEAGVAKKASRRRGRRKAS